MIRVLIKKYNVSGEDKEITMDYIPREKEYIELYGEVFVVLKVKYIINERLKGVELLVSK